MNFKLSRGEYKSITKLDWQDIPELVVITGKNGSGKTQLLELINWHFSAKGQINIDHPFYGVAVETDFHATEKEVIFIPNMWQIGNLGTTNINDHSNITDTLFNHIVLNKINVQWKELASVVETSIGKPKNLISKEDIVTHLPIDYSAYLSKVYANEGLSTMFQLHFARVAECRNRMISEEEIKKTHGIAPWEKLNRLLDRKDFPYRISEPQSIIGKYELKLIKKADPSIIINFSDLSSGEKMFITLVLWMYNTGHDTRLPKLMLLDEPDAHLHPSLSKQFFDVIEKIIVKEYKIRVIMTTHSPSSVSMVSPEYLFEMSKDHPRIKKLKSKEYGINLLTNGLITVKSNTKYVLVEDKNDAKFYNEIFKIFKQRKKINLNINILFISSSNPNARSSGGCTVVRSWVEKFINEGVSDVFQGLMDLDNGNNEPIQATPTDNLYFVKRHSLENYLLDPIIVFASSLHNNSPVNIPGIKLVQKDEYKVAKLEKMKLQKIADQIFKEIEPRVDGLTTDEKELEEITFINRRKLKYPKWFLYRKGHILYNLFRFQYKDAITYDKLIDTIIRQVFLPNDLVDVYKKLQK